MKDGVVRALPGKNTLKYRYLINILGSPMRGRDRLDLLLDLVSQGGIFNPSEGEVRAEFSAFPGKVHRGEGVFDRLLQLSQRFGAGGNSCPDHPCGSIGGEAADLADFDFKRGDFGSSGGNGLTDIQNAPILDIAQEFQGKMNVIGLNPIQSPVGQIQFLSETFLHVSQLSVQRIIELHRDKRPNRHTHLLGLVIPAGVKCEKIQGPGCPGP